MFDSNPRLMTLLNAGSRKIKDAHIEKYMQMDAQVVGRDSIFLYLYLLYHHSCLNYGHTLTRLIDRAVSESLSTRFLA